MLEWRKASALLARHGGGTLSIPDAMLTCNATGLKGHRRESNDTISCRIQVQVDGKCDYLLRPTAELRELVGL